MGIIEDSQKLLGQFIDDMTDVEIRKQNISEHSPHRVIEIEREIKVLEKEVKGLHDDIEKEFSGVEVTKLKTYFDNPVEKGKILDYETKLVELDRLKLAREQEINSYYLKV